MKTSRRPVCRLVVVLAVLSVSVMVAQDAMACCPVGSMRTTTVIPDPNSMGNFIYRTECLAFAPSVDPNTVKCACGLSVPAGYSVTAARVRSATDPNNNLGFLGFTANPASATAFGEVNTPGAGRTWFGFSSSLGTVTPTPGIVSFNLTVPPGTSISQVAAVLPGGFVGAAQSDLSGGVFDPDHTLVVAVAPVSSIPTLSEWGMIALVSLMIFAGMIVMMRRRRRAVA